MSSSKNRVPAVLADPKISELQKIAGETQSIADSALKALSEAMLQWIREKIPEGTVIDLRLERGKPKPDYLHNVKVVSGNSRGTHIFRIERIRFVDPNAIHSDLSEWYADATPISMTTGKDMSSTAGNAKNARKFLGIKGSFGFESFHED